MPRAIAHSRMFCRFRYRAVDMAEDRIILEGGRIHNSAVVTNLSVKEMISSSANEFYSPPWVISYLEKNMIRHQVVFERTLIIMPGQGLRDCHIGTREGIMSRAQFCDKGALLRLNEANAPYFRKRLTSTMLKKSERLGIPKEFVHEHGDRFHRVLSLTGPNGKSRSVTLAVRGADTRARVYLCRGWIGFAKENGFQMGDEVIFWLVASSSFRVLLCSPQSLEKATSTRTNSSKCDEADGTSDDAITSELAPQHPKLAQQDLGKGTSASFTNHEEIQIPPCHVNSNTVESLVPTCCVEAVPPQRPTSNVREKEYVKYPGLNSAVSANSRFPQFVRRLTPSNLNGKHAMRMELPFSFVKKHGDKLQGHVTLLGASDHLRVVDLRVTTFLGQGRVHLGKGWKDFSLENGFSEDCNWQGAVDCSDQKGSVRCTCRHWWSLKYSPVCKVFHRLGGNFCVELLAVSAFHRPPMDRPLLTTSTSKERKLVVSENKTSHVASTEASKAMHTQGNTIASIAWEKISWPMQAETMSSTDRGILRRLQESNAPIFGKTLTRSMLRRTERLEIPSSFIREHGDRFHRVLSLTGPNDKSRSVPLTVRTSVTRPHEASRVFLGRAWNAFAKENGFQVGDDVFFWLGASSTFRVLLCSPEFLQRATTETIKGDEDHGTGDGAVTSEFAPQHPKSTTNHEDIQNFRPGHVNSTPAEAHAPASCVEAVPPQRPTSNVREKEYVKYTGLNSAVSANSRFPQFVKRLTPCNLNGNHATRMELPFSFVKKHGDKLQGHVTLLGASDHLRVVDLRVTTFLGQGRVHLGKGWKDFSLENGFSGGDVLLFSLVGVSSFVVKMFPGARRLED